MNTLAFTTNLSQSIFIHSLQMCACVSVQRMHMLLFVLLTHNTLVSFIAYTYFTTFPALELKEDQTSSVVNFLPEHNLESLPHRKPYADTHTQNGTHKHRHTQGGMKKEERDRVIYLKRK